MRDGQPRLGVAPLNDGERVQRAGWIVLGREAAIVKKNGPKPTALAIAQSIGLGDIVNARGVKSEACENIHEIIRRHHDRSGEAHQASRHGPMRQVILGPAIVIVEDGLLAEQPRDQQSGRGGEIKREISGRENVQDVGAADLGRKPRQIKNESN